MQVKSKNTVANHHVFDIIGVIAYTIPFKLNVSGISNMDTRKRMQEKTQISLYCFTAGFRIRFAVISP